ncbi:flagellar biosynthetic protein FliO [Tianweitania sp. BSSL-BM11]|uniref:Flagellar biosynthetic protein FliO n=1 Tax=Tianweitania aestuarii TaxID=2814886 RepID=A0ABS5RUJ2_9HYPH|nr:flagellar biosynthetic protein FliO [Tianweitania aestuarii]MBS9720711.1 flagellar biosynthetic protein FliO [Tianweitania aestuarii]
MLEWFESIVGPEFAPAAMWTVIAIVALIVLLIVLRIIRGLSSGTFVMGGRNRKARLAVMDATAVDANRRLVLVRRDDVEHLILIGGPTDVVVEQNIRPYAPARQHNEPDMVSPAASRTVQADQRARDVHDLPVAAPQRAPERAAPAVQRRTAAPAVQPQKEHPSQGQQQAYARPAPGSAPAAAPAPEVSHAHSVSPAAERPIAPPIAPPAQRDHEAPAVHARSEPTLDMAPRTPAPVATQRRDDDDSALEDEMNRLLSDYSPEPKR